MKRFLLIVLCCFVLLPIGCTTANENGPHPSEGPDEERSSFDYRYGAFGVLGSATYIIEADDTIFYLCGAVIYFSDKNYKDFLPLCARPNCNHKDMDCDAYIDSTAGIWLYDDHIYYAAEIDPNDEIKSASLRRMRLDGSRHEELLRFDPVDMGFAPQYCKWQFSFYDNFVIVNYSAAKNSTGNEIGTAWGTVDLNDIKLPDYELNNSARENTDENYYKGLWLFEDGDLMYELNYVNRTDGTLGCRLTVWDQTADEYRLLAELTERPDYMSGCYMIYDKAFYYLTWDGTTKRLHRVDLETGVDEIIAEGGYEELPIAYFDWKYGALMGLYMDPDGDPAKSVFYAYDTELNLMGSFTCAGLPEEIMNIAIFLQTDNYLFAAPQILMDPDDPNSWGSYAAFAIPTWYIDKSEIGTGNLAWHRWEPEG